MISSINGRTTQKCIGKSNKHWLVIWKVSVCQYKGSHLLKKQTHLWSLSCCALLIVSLAITVISRVRPSVPIKHEQSSNAGRNYPFFAILPFFHRYIRNILHHWGYSSSSPTPKFVTKLHSTVILRWLMIMPIFHALKTVHHLASPGSPWQGGRFLNFVRGGFPF